MGKQLQILEILLIRRSFFIQHFLRFTIRYSLFLVEAL